MTGEARYNPAIHHRRSIRLQDYDYSQAGAYFITICVQNRECLFGEIINGAMTMNEIGRMVQTVWNEIPSRFDGLELNTFTIMPNHIHGIIMLNRHRRGESCIRPSYSPPCIPPATDQSMDNMGDGHQNKGHNKGDHKDRPYDGGGTLPGTVGRIIQAFKSISTHEYTVGVKKLGWPPFPGKLWQRNYWEHIIRNETELNHIKEYILNNPTQWESDKLYCRPDKV
jgi:REP element-mobilizing transposase RayT